MGGGPLLGGIQSRCPCLSFQEVRIPLHVSPTGPQCLRAIRRIGRAPRAAVASVRTRCERGRTPYQVRCCTGRSPAAAPVANEAAGRWRRCSPRECSRARGRIRIGSTEPVRGLHARQTVPSCTGRGVHVCSTSRLPQPHGALPPLQEIRSVHTARSPSHETESTPSVQCSGCALGPSEIEICRVRLRPTGCLSPRFLASAIAE
jgi:hypothetical protein